MAVSRAQFLQTLLRTGALRRLGLEGLFAQTEDDDEDDDSNQTMYRRMRSRRERERKPHPPLVRQSMPEGRALMDSGVFGVNDRQQDSHEKKDEDEEEPLRKRKRVASRIMQRELGLGSPGKERSHNRLVSQELLPSSSADTIINYDERCYSGQFSEDGNFYFSCCQDFRVRMYDTSNPYNWRHYKTVTYPYGQWTITDATLSPDNKYLACSSSSVCVS